MYIPKGTDKALEILNNSKNVLAYYDPDVDGLIGGHLGQLFMHRRGINTSYYLNQNRGHGFLMPESTIQRLIGYTVLAIDFSMTTAEVIHLTDLGVSIINIDHHNINETELFEYKSEISGASSVIINNQYCFEPEEYRFLSGAGVAYYVFKAIDEGFDTLDNRSLVGITLLSDIRPLENKIAKSFLHDTYNNRSAKMQYLIDTTKSSTDFGFGVQIMDRNFIDYTFSPKMNALFRLNMGDEAVRIINGFSTLKRDDLEIYKRMQSAIVHDIKVGLRGIEGSNLIVKFVPHTLEVTAHHTVSNFIGLVCSNIKNNGKTTFLFVEKDGKVLRGSVRGLYDNVNYLEIFRSFGFKCEGHKPAFGVMETDLSKVDIEGLNNAIRDAEESHKGLLYEGRILDVNNLGMFIKSQNAMLATHNIYVRDSHRVYIRYTGANVIKKEKGKMWEFHIDGVVVKAFDDTLNMENSLILPLLERGNYIQFFLHRKIN